MEGVNGLHHVTAIAGPAQENLDFYAGILGMRLVKKSVNQDDPGTYHLFYADAAGHPGTDLTFFPWAQHRAAAPGTRSEHRGRRWPSRRTASISGGSGSRATVSRSAPIETRFGERVLPLTDTHGLKVALVESASAHAPHVHAVGRQPDSRRPSDPRARGRAHAGSATSAPTDAFLTGVLGFSRLRARGRLAPLRRARRRPPDATSISRRRRTRGAARGASAASITWRGASTTRTHQADCARGSTPPAGGRRR